MFRMNFQDIVGLLLGSGLIIAWAVIDYIITKKDEGKQK